MKLAGLAETLSIRAIAKSWSYETSEPATALEETLIQAARRHFSEQNNSNFWIDFLSAKDRGQAEEEAKAELLEAWPGLHTAQAEGSVTSRTPVSRADLKAWCVATGLEPPRFWFAQAVSTAKARSECRQWLRDLAAEGSKPGTKSELREYAESKFKVSGRFFDEMWKEVAPDEWKAAGAPSKSTRR